tara:strand:- start:1463 stop:1663 length:201 start_codon:yes stop_codon:yes gene_type:complete
MKKQTLLRQLASTHNQLAEALDRAEAAERRAQQPVEEEPEVSYNFFGIVIALGVVGAGVWGMLTYV